MKRFLIVLTALLLVSAFITGCAGQPAASEPAPELQPADVAPDPVLSVCVGKEPRSLDPVKYATAQEATYLVQLFEGLTTVAADGRVTAAAAKLWTTGLSDYDQPVYTFKLREDAVWSDGVPVKAQDFVFAWQRAADPATEAPYAYLMAVLENGAAILDGKAEPKTLGVKAEDDATLVVTLEGPCPYFPQLLTLPVFFPVRSDIVEADPTGWAAEPETFIGNGYFTLKDWTHDGSITMVKNDAHYTCSDSAGVEDTPTALDELIFRFYENDDLAEAAFAAGELHYLADRACGAALPAQEPAESDAEGESASSAAEAEPVEAQPAVVGVDLLAESYYFVANRTSGPTLNYKFGRALALALDRDALIEALTLMDAYQPAAGLVPGGMTAVFTKKPFRELAGDPLSALCADGEDALTAAKRYLAEAGFPDGANAPALTLLTNDTPAQAAIANAAAEIWKNTLGVTVTVKVLPYDEFIRERDAGNFDLARGGAAADGYDPACLLDLFRSDYAGAWYSNADYDALMTSAALEENATVRSLSLIEAERALVEQGVVIPVLFGRRFTRSCETLTGVIATGLDIRYFMYASH